MTNRNAARANLVAYETARWAEREAVELARRAAALPGQDVSGHFRLEVRAKETAYYSTAKEAILAGLALPWGTPWQAFIAVPGAYLSLGRPETHLLAWHNQFGTIERALENADTYTH